MCNILQSNQSYIPLGQPARIWTVPAIHGNLDALTCVHDAILEAVRPGDRIVYHGNYTGYGENPVACIHEILTFRRMVLAMPGMKASDIVYLRGRQEQIMDKLMQLHFAPDPSAVLLWMLANGLSPTLYDYGLSPHDGIEACRYGVLGITKWSNKIRAAIRAHAGHETFYNQLKRAAYTSEDSCYPMLFVHAGLDAHQSLTNQGDDLWWGADKFDMIDSPYKPYEKVIRGFDPEHRGMLLNCVTATVDDGCGFGGNLVSVGFEADGNIAGVYHS